jgi:hemoglobin-like flavoprotein
MEATAVTTATDAQLLATIQAQMNIQKRNAQTTKAWKDASHYLASLFAEAKRRNLQGVVS